MSTITERRSYYEDMTVDVPEGESNGVAVKHFEVKRDSFENLRLGSRACAEGTYTMLTRKGALWMSDTSAEKRDHIDAARQINRGGRVLLGGLGLGMILRYALLTPEVTEVDVVEIDADVLALVGPHYQEMAKREGKVLRLHEADLFQIKWPVGTTWNVAFFDVWPNLCEDNLESMGKLRRSYGRRADWCDCWGRRADWCDCWGRELLVAERRRTADAWWRR